MAKVLSILILLAVIAGTFFAVKYSKDSYELLPINQQEPMKEWEEDLAHNFQNWHEFTPPAGSFKVLLPGLPQHATENNATRKYDMYATTDDKGRAYMINAITFPINPKPGEEGQVLKDAVNDMIERSKENKLRMMQPGKLRQFDTLDFALENGEVTVSGKAFFHGNTLYILSMIDKTDQFNDKVLSFFINSFSAEDITRHRKFVDEK
jgi:hypothetical protein